MPEHTARQGRYSPAQQRMIQQMIEAEAQALGQPAQDDPECECREGMFPGLSRRGMLFGGAALGTALLSSRPSAANPPPGSFDYWVQPDPTKEQGRLILDDGGYGSRSQFENELRWRYPTASLDSSWSMCPSSEFLGQLAA